MSSSAESGNPADDARGFRRALGQFATGVTIVTAQHDGQHAGVTANSFSSVSLDPPLILWSIAKSSQSLALLQKATHFAVNVLAADQMELASRFARSGIDKFAGVPWQPGLGGAPLFAGTAASFECRTAELIDAGDHYIMLGQVERYTRTEQDLLLFAQGRFGLAVDYPAVAAEAPPAPDPAHANLPTTMLGLLWDAFSALSHGFHSERDVAGMTISQGRVLSLIERHPGVNAEFLTRKAFVSPQAVDDALAELRDAGAVQATAQGGWEVTPSGRVRVLALRRRATMFEADQLRDFTEAELDITRRVLRALGTAQP